MRRAALRRCLVALCATASAGVLTAGAPAPAVAQTNLFPTAVGSVWNFMGKAGKQSFMMRAENVLREPEGGNTRVQQRWTMNGRVVQDEVYVVSATEVVRKASGPGASQVLNPPLPVMRLPLSAGKGWSWKGTISKDGAVTANATATFKVTRRETVRMRGSSVSAWRIDMKLTVVAGARRATLPNTYWYAPGKGLVRQRATIQAGRRSFTVDATATTVRLK